MTISIYDCRYASVGLTSFIGLRFCICNSTCFRHFVALHKSRVACLKVINGAFLYGSRTADFVACPLPLPPQSEAREEVVHLVKARQQRHLCETRVHRQHAVTPASLIIRTCFYTFTFVRQTVVLTRLLVRRFVRPLDEEPRHKSEAVLVSPSLVRPISEIHRRALICKQ
jgi:hypothetical protein